MPSGSGIRGIRGAGPNKLVWIAACAGALSGRSLSARIGSPALPAVRYVPEKQNPRLSVKPCQEVAHARARVRKIRSFDHPYTPRMREQSCASGGKAAKLGLTNIPRVSTNSFSALPCVRGERADAHRSAHSLYVDWQAWGTQSGPCWRATPDGVRHVPAGPPKSGVPKNLVTPLSRDTHKQPFTARTASISSS